MKNLLCFLFLITALVLGSSYAKGATEINYKEEIEKSLVEMNESNDLIIDLEIRFLDAMEGLYAVLKNDEEIKRVEKIIIIINENICRYEAMREEEGRNAKFYAENLDYNDKEKCLAFLNSLKSSRRQSKNLAKIITVAVIQTENKLRKITMDK